MPDLIRPSLLGAVADTRVKPAYDDIESVMTVIVARHGRT
jgi:hypothetical protein